ncbi:MAG: DUF2911 domain-containing protein [Cyclobacteriaceae bacterium]
MKSSAIKMFGLSGILVLSVVFLSFCQERASPPKIAEGTINGADITVNYSSPAVKGRTIFGDLVAMGKVWRAGANEATLFETSKDIKVGGETLSAGKYSFFILPEESASTFIFNKQTGQWGTQYDGDQDVLRVKVENKKSSSLTENLTYEIQDDGMLVKWENYEAKVKIE